MITSTLTYEVSSVADRIYSNFKTKSYLRGLVVNLNQIKDVLNNYVLGLVNKKIPVFNSQRGSDAKKVVDYIVSKTSYNKEIVYFILYELEDLAKKGVLTAQKILRYSETKQYGGTSTQKASFPFIPSIDVKSGLGDVKQILLYALIILLILYFAPVLSNVLKQITKEK